MLGSPNLEYSTDYYNCQSFVKLQTLDQQHKTCSTLNKELNGTLQQEWNNCTIDNPLKNNPLWKSLDEDQKQTKINAMCCEEVLQCNNPNQWLKQHNYNVTCTYSGKGGDFPHFAVWVGVK